MADKSAIEWTEATWNPVVGCSILSPGCINCYAMKMAARIEKMHPGTHYAGTTKPSKAGPVWTGKLTLAPDHILTQPLRWRKARTIFVNSMGDLFHEDVPDEWIDRVFAVMALCPQHTFQVLTKRSRRMREYVVNLVNRDDIVVLAANYSDNLPLETRRVVERTLQLPLPNVWLGVSAERQQEAEERIPDLLATPAAIRFVSAEPLLGPISFRWAKWDNWRDSLGRVRPTVNQHDGLRMLDWIIVGGESGPGARPMHPDWARSIRDQCAAAGVPFFFKQWGEWGMPTDTLGKLDWPYHPDYNRTHWFDSRTCVRPIEARWSDKYVGGGGAWPPPPFDMFKTPEYLDQVARCPQTGCREAGRCIGNEKRAAVTWRGKKASGRLLDGIAHNGMPAPREVPFR